MASLYAQAADVPALCDDFRFLMHEETDEAGPGLGAGSSMMELPPPLSRASAFLILVAPCTTRSTFSVAYMRKGREGCIDDRV